MKLTRSIRWRLLAWLALLLGVLVVGFGLTAYHLQRVQVLSQVDEQLERSVTGLSEAVRSGGPPERPPGPSGSDAGRPPLPPPDRRVLDPEALAEGFVTGDNFVVWSRRGNIRASNFDEAPERPERRGRETRVRFRDRDGLREAYHFTELGECMLVGRSMAGAREELRRAAWSLALAAGGVLALGLGGGWYLVTRSLRPVEEMGESARRIAHGDLTERVPVADPENELGRLAEVLNETFDRLESAFDRQRQFTADASHELRTPLALVISEAQTVLAHERSAGEYREALGECLAAALRMRDLTSSLLQLARIDGHATEAEGFDLGACVATQLEAMSKEIVAAGVFVENRVDEVECRGDAVRAGIVVANLLRNALDHTPRDGSIRVSSTLEAGEVRLSVEDSGPGITAADLPQLFERFYRADKARSRTEGRFGLGLAICKAAVEADGGSIVAESPPGKGARFTVRWVRA